MELIFKYCSASLITKFTLLVTASITFSCVLSIAFSDKEQDTEDGVLARDVAIVRISFMSSVSEAVSKSFILLMNAVHDCGISEAARFVLLVLSNSCIFAFTSANLFLAAFPDAIIATA